MSKLGRAALEGGLALTAISLNGAVAVAVAKATATAMRIIPTPPDRSVGRGWSSRYFWLVQSLKASYTLWSTKGRWAWSIIRSMSLLISPAGNPAAGWIRTR